MPDACKIKMCALLIIFHDTNTDTHTRTRTGTWSRDVLQLYQRMPPQVIFISRKVRFSFNFSSFPFFPFFFWFSLRCKDEAFCVTSALWSFFTLQLVQAPLTGCTPTGWGPVVVYSHTHTHVCRYTHPVHTCEHTNMLAHTHTRTHMHTRTDMHTSKNIKLGLRGVRSPALLRGNYGRKLVAVKKYIWLVEYFWN